MSSGAVVGLVFFLLFLLLAVLLVVVFVMRRRGQNLPGNSPNIIIIIVNILFNNYMKSGEKFRVPAYLYKLTLL